MSREIEFRVRCSTTKEILGYEHFNACLNAGYYYTDSSKPIDDGDGGIDYICQTEFSDQPMLKSKFFGQLIREQFTGLLDCNGAKIFEGDIVLITEIDEDSSSGTEFTKEPVAVVMRNFQWMFDNGKYKVLGQKDWTDYATLSSYCRHDVDFKVIGNIHQNSELLK